MKKNRRGRKIIIVIVCVLVAVLAALWLVFHFLTGRTNYLRDKDVAVNKEAYETELLTEAVTEEETERPLHPEDIYDLHDVKKISPARAANTFTFLIIGAEEEPAAPAEAVSEGASESTDEVEEATEDADGADVDSQRADAQAVITMTVNHNTGEVWFYSFHTDMYVHIPDFGPGRLCNAYAVGGGPLMIRTMEENFGISIDHYATISLRAVAEVIQMPEFEHLDINRDGLEVVEELVYSMGRLNPAQVAGYISKLLPYVTHNMTAQELLQMVMQIPRIVPYYGYKEKVPDEAASYDWQELDGYVVADAKQLSEHMQSTLYPLTESLQTESLLTESLQTENLQTEGES